jgi:hypothetical protein
LVWAGSAAGATGNSLERKPRPKRPSPFKDFPGWGSDGPKKAPKPAPADPKPEVVPKPIDPPSAVAPKPIDPQSAVGAAFKKASDALKVFATALGKKSPDPNEIADTESKAAAARRELSVAIAVEAVLMVGLNQAASPTQAILILVKAHAEHGKVDAADEVLFREAAKDVLKQTQTSQVPQK